MSAVVKKEQASTDKTHTADELRNVNLNLTGFQKLALLAQQVLGKQH